MKNKIALLIILILAISSANLTANNDSTSIKRQLINQYTSISLRYLQTNNLDSAMLFANKAMEVDSLSLDVNYNKALIWIKKGKHQKAIDLLESKLNNPDARDYHYQIVASSYDIIGSKNTALKLLETAQVKFPASGRICYEIGIIQYSSDDKYQALITWTQGIEREPTFDGNYYHLAMHYSTQPNKIWALYYAECYVALATNANKSKKLSKMMYDLLADNYRNGKFYLVDSTIDVVSRTISFEYILAMGLDSVFSAKKAMPKNIGLKEINTLYSEFLDNYLRNGLNEKLLNALIDYKKSIRDKGQKYLEVYNYIIFSNGNPKELSLWLDKNENKYEECTQWLEKNNFAKFLTDNLSKYQFITK